jgi:hypothetical protein
MNEKIDRTCATCACLLMQTNPMNPLHKQGFCRLNPPKHARGVVEVPRMDMKTATPVIGKDGKPVLEKQEQDFYLYEPTMPQLTCFRGWRPVDSEPGRHNIADDMAVLMDAMQPILNALGIHKAPLDS